MALRLRYDLGIVTGYYVTFTVSTDTAWFIRCHLQASAYFGGNPRRLLYDNLKSVVLKRDADGTIHWTPRFLDFDDVVGFSPQLCRTYRPQTNGRAERLFGTLQGRLVVQLRLARASTLEQANELLACYLQRYNAQFAVLPLKRAVTPRQHDSFANQRLQLLPNPQRRS